MTQDTPNRLTDELRQADAAAGVTPPLPPDLAQRVRRRVRQRQVMRRSAATGASLLAACVAVALWAQQHQHGTARVGASPAPVQVAVVQPPTVPEIQQARAELTRVEAEADQQQQVVTRLEVWEQQQGRLAELDARLAEPDSLEKVQAQVERAALITLKDAERLAADPSRRGSARAEYGRIVALYPRTTWAAVARQRLSDAGG